MSLAPVKWKSSPALLRKGSIYLDRSTIDPDVQPHACALSPKPASSMMDSPISFRQPRVLTIGKGMPSVMVGQQGSFRSIATVPPRDRSESDLHWRQFPRSSSNRAQH